MTASSRVAAVVAAMAVLAGCSWRLETPPPQWPSPSPETLLRDAAADREQGVLDAIGTVDDQSVAGRSAIASVEAAAAPVHLDALGGVYVAYPGASPSPSRAPLTLPAAVRDARDGSLRAAWDDEAGALTPLLTSIGLSHALAAWYGTVQDARAAGVEVARVAERRLPVIAGVPDPALVPATTTLAAADLEALVVAHDRARYVYEVIAARSQGQVRADALARQAIHRDRADALVALLGDDPREPVASIPTAQVTGEETQRATARALEQALGWDYAALAAAATDDDRAWLLSGAFDAYTASATLPGFTPEEWPVLPGLDGPAG